jgi:hypothetical protein
MSLITFVVVLVCFAILLWAARKFITDPLLKKLAIIVIIIAAVYFVLSVLGILPTLKGLQVPKLT